MSYIGIGLALASACLSGTSIVLQKTGLMQSIDSPNGYLSSSKWWAGMACLILSELFNFIAYAFAPAILVTPLGAVSVAVSALLSVVVLRERINFSGVSGICLCIIGSTIIVLHGPDSTATTTIPAFYANVLMPGFICYFLVCFITIMYLIFIGGPRYGSTNPVVYISMTSICGFGSSVVYTIANQGHDNQFAYWGIYPLLAFIIVAAFFQIIYLNKALIHFSTSVVTPITFVFFSTMTLVTSAILYRGFNVAGYISAASIVLGFLVVIVGVALIFQYNLKLNKLAQELVGDPEQEENPIAVIHDQFSLDRTHPAFARTNTRSMTFSEHSMHSVSHSDTVKLISTGTQTALVSRLNLSDETVVYRVDA